MAESQFTLSCGDAVLADGTYSGGMLEEVSLNGARIIDVAQLARAQWIVLFDRGNKRNTFRLKWSVVCPSLAAAADVCAGFADDLPNLGDFNLQLAAAGLNWSGLMLGAGWDAPQAELIGVTVKFSCTVTGGQLIRAGAGFAGSGAAGGFYAAIGGGLSDYAAAAIAATGTASYVADATVSFLTQAITVGAGGGAFAAAIALSATNRRTGHRDWLKVSMPASANPTVQIVDVATSAVLAAVPADAAKAREFQFLCSFNGVAWSLLASQEAGAHTDDTLLYGARGGGMSATAALSVAAAGNSLITPELGVSFHDLAASVAAGSGAYTAKLVLDVTGRLIGQRIRVSVAMPESANPTVEIHDATAGGTLLATVPADASTARNYLYLAVFDGSAFVLLASEEVLS